MKPTIPDVLPLVRAYVAKPGNGAGGNLYAVLDDGNINDSDIQYCLLQSLREGDRDGELIARRLLEMSKTQRKKIAMRAYG